MKFLPVMRKALFAPATTATGIVQHGLAVTVRRVALMLLLITSAAQPALGQSEEVVVDCLPPWETNDRFMTATVIKHPSLSLNGFDCGSNCDIGYGLKQVLEKVYGTNQDDEVKAIFRNMVNLADSPFMEGGGYGDLVKNTEILQAKGLVALAAYVLENNDYDPTSLDPALPPTALAVGTFWAALSSPPYRWKMLEQIHSDGIRWSTPVTNTARTIDFYLALENAYKHYDIASYNSITETGHPMDFFNKTSMMFAYREMIHDLDDRGRQGINIPLLINAIRYNFEPGNAPLKMQVAAGYAALVWQDNTNTNTNKISTYSNHPRSLGRDEFIRRAFTAAGAFATQSDHRESRYWYYQSANGNNFWAEGPYYFHITLSDIIPFWHTARINGLLAHTGIHSYTFPDPFFQDKFLQPLHWLADLSTPDGKTPPLDDGNKKTMYNAGILNWTGGYGSDVIGEKFSRIFGSIKAVGGLSLQTSLYPLALAIPRRPVSASILPDGIIGNEFHKRRDGGGGHQEVVVRRTIDNKQHYIVLNGETDPAIWRGDGHEQADQMQLLYYVDDISYLVDSGYDRPLPPSLTHPDWDRSTWNDYPDHNVMTLEPDKNGWVNNNGGVRSPHVNIAQAHHVQAEHQDVHEISYRTYGKIDLLSAGIDLKAKAHRLNLLASGRRTFGNYYRNVLFIRDENHPYIVDINAVKRVNDYTNWYKMYYHVNSNSTSKIRLHSNTLQVAALRWNNMYVSEEKSSPESTNNSLYIQPFTIERPLYLYQESDNIRESYISADRGLGIPVKKMRLNGSDSLPNGDSKKYFTTVALIRVLPNGEANPDIAKGNRPLPADGDRAWQYITWKHDSTTVDVIVAHSSEYYADPSFSSSSPGISYFPVSEADSLYLQLFSISNYGFARLKKQGQTWSIDPNFKLNIKIFEAEAQVDGPHCIAEGSTGTFTATGSFTNPVVEFVAPYSYNWEYYYGGSCTRDIPCGWNPLNIPGNTNSRTVDFGGNGGEDFDIRVTVTDSSSPAQSIVSSDLRVQVLAPSEGVCPSNPDDAPLGKKDPDNDSKKMLASDANLLEAAQDIPETYALRPNFPNPFNLSTEIQFDLPEDAMVSLTVYDVLGREVARLVQGELPAGTHRARFDAGNLPSGVYFYRIQAGDFSSTHRMTLLK